MKVSVASKKQKIYSTIILVILWILTALLVALEVVSYLESLQNNAKEYTIFPQTIIVSVTVVVITIMIVVIAVSNVVIDESGITLRRGAIKVKHFSWEEIKRVETFEALYRRSLVVSDAYISVLNTNEASWAFTYKRPPINLGASNISFAYDSQAFDLIKQYYDGEICS